MPNKDACLHPVTYDPDQVFNFIVKYKTQNDGNSPSIREIMKAIGSNSTSCVKNALIKLEEQGKIYFPNGIGIARHIHVTDGQWIFRFPHVR